MAFPLKRSPPKIGEARLLVGAGGNLRKRLGWRIWGPLATKELLTEASLGLARVVT